MRPLKEHITEQVLADVPDEEAIRILEERGYVVHKPVPPVEPVRFDPARIRGRKRVRLGIASDTHFGSKWQQPTLLRQQYRYFRRRGVDAVLIPGDVTDGSIEMHKGFGYELWAHSADAQREAAAEFIPDIGVPQFLIAGNHDASHFKAAGHDIVKALCDMREDLHYLGPEVTSRNQRGSTGYVEFDGVLVQLAHPHLPPTRTRSYRLETWLENVSSPRPHIVVMGNFHKPVEINFRNIWGLMVPAFQATTPWMASKGTSSVVGGCIIEFGTATKGVAPSMSVEWLIEYEPMVNDYPGGRW